MDRQKGKDVSVRFIVDGVPVTKGWEEVRSHRVTPNAEISRTGFLGRTTSQIDEEHDGYDVEVTLQKASDAINAWYDEQARRHRERLPSQDVQMQIRELFRDPTVGGVIRTYYAGKMKLDEDRANDMKDFTEMTLSGMFPSRKTTNLPARG